MKTQRKFDRSKFMGPGAKPGAKPSSKPAGKPTGKPPLGVVKKSTSGGGPTANAVGSRSKPQMRPDDVGSQSRRPPRNRPERGPAPRRGRGERRKDAYQSKSIETAKGPLHATVDKNRKGFAYLIPQGGWSKKDVFVSANVARHLFPGDVVKLRLRGRIPREIHSIEELELVEHRLNVVIGKAYPNPARTQSRKAPQKGAKAIGSLVWERKQNREEIPLYGSESIDFTQFSEEAPPFIQAKLVFPEQGLGAPTAQLIKVLGATIPASMDVEQVASEYGLQEFHSEEAVADAKARSAEFHALDDKGLTEGRTDLRHLPWITIDGETARDFDDAVYVEKQSRNYVLWVGIADVSHFVQPGSALDEDAYQRATSVYFPERAFHMLPSALSEDVCSLRPNQPRFAMVLKRVFSPRGDIISTDVLEAVILSKRRATYLEIQAEYEKARERDQLENFEYRNQFELYYILKKKRQARGSIDFELPEAQIACGPDGEPTGIHRHPRVDAHRLIEEFMIAANEGVTEWMVGQKLPFLFRIHEEPDPAKLEMFMEQAIQAEAPFAYEGERPLPRDINNYLQSLQAHPAAMLLNQLLLRSMKQAIYSPKHEIHYGLASESYTHFTSPIRRYPDLIVHRLLRTVLRGQKQQLLEKQVLTELEMAAAHCSQRERTASQVERDCIRIKQVRYMMRHEGEQFPGRIVGVAEKGVFVQIDEPFVEGVILKDALEGDFFTFEEEKLRFVGRKTRRSLKMGDPIRIEVVHADLDSRQVLLKEVQEGKK